MSSDMNKASILIVDDNSEAIDMLRLALPEHYKKQVVKDGKSALKLLSCSSSLPDIILMDIDMPEMDGYTTSQIIKQNEKYKDIPIIFLSGYDDIESKIKAFSIGGVDYITKPYKFEEVRIRINSHLKLSSHQHQLENQNHNLEGKVREKINEIAELQMATIYALVKLVDFRDENTGDHLERMQTICKMLAQELSKIPIYEKIIDAKFVDRIFKASPLHDVGKVGIPDSILLKPGKLTVKEYDIMKEHTVIGARALQEVTKKYSGNNFLEMGVEMALYHHEKWDGSGYPFGKTGSQIPLSARIVALADAFDAMMSQRPYKDAYSYEKTCSIIKEESEKHFDPNVVNAFFAIEKDIKKLLDLENGHMI